MSASRTTTTTFPFFGGQQQPVRTTLAPRNTVRPLTQNEVASLPPSAGEQAVAEFMATYPQCGSREEIYRYINLIKAANWRGIDVLSVVRTLRLGGTIHGAKINPSKSRFAKGEFSGETLGVRGKKKNIKFPSLLWEVVLNNCGELGALNDGIESIIEGEYGLIVPNVPIPDISIEPPSDAEVNNALAEFFAAHPECQVNQQDIYKFLNLIDQAHLSGVDIFSILRSMGLEGHLPTMPRSGSYRTAKMAIAQQVPAVRGRAAELQKYKNSLLWMIFSNYCADLKNIILEMEHILSGQLSASTIQQHNQRGGVQMRTSASFGQMPFSAQQQQQQFNQFAAPTMQPPMTMAGAPAAATPRRKKSAATTSAFPQLPAPTTTMTLGPFNPFAPQQPQQRGIAGTAFAPAGFIR